MNGYQRVDVAAVRAAWAILVDLRGQVQERDQELDAARAANRELIANLNRRP